MQAGLATREEVADIPSYGPKNGYFLAHELQVRDVRVWLARVGRAYPHHSGVELWQDGKAAWIGDSRPDALFRYRMREDAALTCLTEVDRGTERGPAKWEDKLRRYVRLLPDEALLRTATGAGRVRVLVTAPTPRRRDELWRLISDFVPPALADRFWLCERPVLESTDLAASVWRMAGRAEALPLVWREIPLERPFFPLYSRQLLTRGTESSSLLQAKLHFATRRQA